MSDPANTESGELVSLTGSSVGRFSIRERIGTGGMGEVYRAHDTRLNRSVAIKRMAGPMRSDPASRRRFLKEAERVSQLSDPHVAALYDILEEDGDIYLVMELVDGENLRQFLKHETSLKDLLAIAIQTAEGVRSAHSRHIIHCDIKPENIMINAAGQVKVLDFGLARQVSGTGHATSVLSGSGIVSGTPGYMAPEAMLDEAPDSRSDIFALGTVLYEALSGKHPFLKRTVFETADSVLHATPAPLTSFGVPVPLSDIVDRMMQKDPAQRYQNADELLADLTAFAQTVDSQTKLAAAVSLPSSKRTTLHGKKWIWSGVVALLFVAVALIAFGPGRHAARRMGRVLGLSKAPQVAVLPFQHIGGDPSQQAFADGLSDVITSELTQLSDRYLIQVIPSSEIRSDHTTSAKGARQQFGADLVVEGSLQPVANMVRATFSIVDANTGRQVQAGTVSVSATDPFGIQDQLATSIVRALGIDASTLSEGDSSARGTAVPAAYDDYLQGLGYIEDYQKKENLDLAISSFNRALGHDSSYALAYAGLGEAHWHKYRELSDTSEMSDAILACQRSLAVDSDLVEGHRCLGELYGSSGKYGEAAKELELAVKKRPTDDESVRALGNAYEELREFDKAEATYRRAIDLRPHYWASYNWLGAFYAGRGQYAKALDMFNRVMAIAPENYRGYNNAGGIYIFQGDFAKATQLFEKSVSIRPAYAAYSNLGTAYFFQRQFERSAAAYSKALELKDRDYVTWGNLGDAQYFAPGQRNSSPASYHKAIELAAQKLKVNPQDAGALGSTAMYLAMLGDHRGAQDHLRRALDMKPEGPDVWWQASVVYAQAGKFDETLSALQSALAAGLSSSYISSAAYFDNLRTDPRFQQLIRSAEKLERH